MSPLPFHWNAREISSQAAFFQPESLHYGVELGHEFGRGCGMSVGNGTSFALEDVRGVSLGSWDSMHHIGARVDVICEDGDPGWGEALEDSLW